MKLEKHPFQLYELSAIDSDTVKAWVEVDSVCRIQWRIRLLGIEGGELSDPVGLASARATAVAIADKDFMSAHFHGNHKTLDKYGRHVGDIRFEDGTLLTHILFQTGLYWRRDRNGQQHPNQRK